MSYRFQAGDVLVECDSLSELTEAMDHMGVVDVQLKGPKRKPTEDRVYTLAKLGRTVAQAMSWRRATDFVRDNPESDLIVRDAREFLSNLEKDKITDVKAKRWLKEYAKKEPGIREEIAQKRGKELGLTSDEISQWLAS